MSSRTSRSSRSFYHCVAFLDNPTPPNTRHSKGNPVNRVNLVKREDRAATEDRKARMLAALADYLHGRGKQSGLPHRRGDQQGKRPARWDGMSSATGPGNSSRRPRTTTIFA